jgi:hypothetical protein
VATKHDDDDDDDEQQRSERHFATSQTLNSRKEKHKYI